MPISIEGPVDPREGFSGDSPAASARCAKRVGVQNYRAPGLAEAASLMRKVVDSNFLQSETLEARGNSRPYRDHREG
jgi:hypothetical protein